MAGGGDMAEAQPASVLEWLLPADFQTAAAAVATATAAMWWPDQAAGSAALICKCAACRSLIAHTMCSGD